MALLYGIHPHQGGQPRLSRLTVAGLGQRASDDTQDSGEHHGCRPSKKGPSETAGHKPPLVCGKPRLQWGSRAFLSHQHRTQGGPRACSQIWHLDQLFKPKETTLHTKASILQQWQRHAPLSVALHYRRAQGTGHRGPEKRVNSLGKPQGQAQSCIFGGLCCEWWYYEDPHPHPV